MPTRTPDVTAAQWLAFLTWAASQAVAFGLLTSVPSQLALSASASALALAWKWADAHIRGRRSAVAAAAIYTAGQRPEAPTVRPPAP